MNGIRAVQHTIYRAWTNIWRPTPTAEQQVPAVAQAPPVVEVPFSRPIPSTTHSTDGLGSLYLDLFEDVYRRDQRLHETRRRLIDLTDRHNGLQMRQDSLICGLRRAEDGVESDFDKEMGEWRNAISAMEVEKTDLIVMTRDTKAEVRRLESDIALMWARIYRNAQIYVDMCLEVDFDEDWSLTHSGCVMLRIALDKHELFMERGQELSRLQHARSKRTASRVNDLDPGEDINAIPNRITQLAEILKMSRQHCKEAEKDCLKASIRHLLAESGRIAPTPTSRPEQSPATRQNPPKGLSMPTHPPANEIERTQFKYMLARHRLVESQEKLAKEEFMIKQERIDHFLTFSKASIESWERICDDEEEVEEARRDVQLMEEVCLNLRESLEDLGAEIPRSPEVGLGEASVGGGLRRDFEDRESEVEVEAGPPSMSSSERWRGKRRRVNDYRFGTGRSPANPEVRTPPSRPCTPEEMSVYSSPSGTPNSGRKRKLREFMETQRAMRDGFESGESDERPRYRKDGLVETYWRRSRRSLDEDDDA